MHVCCLGVAGVPLGVRRHVLTFSEIPILISYIRYIVIDELPSAVHVFTVAAVSMKKRRLAAVREGRGLSVVFAVYGFVKTKCKRFYCQRDQHLLIYLIIYRHIRINLQLNKHKSQYNMHAARPAHHTPLPHIALPATGGIIEPVELSVLVEGRWALRRVHCIEVVEVLTPNSCVIFGRAGLLGLHGRS